MFTRRIIGVYFGFGSIGGARLGKNSLALNRPVINFEGTNELTRRVA